MSPDRGATRETLGFLASARRASGRRLTFTDLYTVVLGIATYAALAVSAVHALSGAAPAATSVGPAQFAGLALGSLVLTALIAGLVGPMGADPATLSWVHASPLPRGRVLATRYAALLALGAGWGALAGSMISAVRGWPFAVGASVAVAAVSAVAVVAASTLAQTSRAVRFAARAVLGVCIVAAVAALLPLWAGAARRAVASLAPVSEISWWVVLAVAALSLILVAAAAARLDRVPGRELSRGGAAMGAWSTSMAQLDSGAVALWAEGRRTSAHPRHRPARLRGSGAGVLLAVDLLGIRRGWARVAGMVLAVLASVAAVRLLGPAATGAVLVGGVAIVTASSAGGLRVWARSAAIRRAYPFSDRIVLGLFLIGPTVLAVLASAAAVALSGLPGGFVVVVVIAALASLLAGADPRPVDFGLVVTTPMGSLPIDLVRRLVVGPLLAASLGLVGAAWGTPLGTVLGLGWLGTSLWPFVSAAGRPRGT